MTSDSKRRFLFEQMDIRGELVHLDDVITDVAAIHDYPSGVTGLLGEFLASSVLLAGTLKFRGSLTVQARSDREVPLIMAECNNEFDVRAIARGAQQATGTSFTELLGDGQLVLTITPSRGERYQGIVPLSGDSLASSIDAYFEQSEQLNTRLFLSSDGDQAAGLLLQQLPPQLAPDEAKREQHWDHVTTLAQTLTASELLGLADYNLLYRLFHEEAVRVFEPDAIRFRCSCSRDRTFAALASLQTEEIQDILEVQGAITMDCEFCNQRYVFQEPDLAEFLTNSTQGPVH